MKARLSLLVLLPTLLAAPLAAQTFLPPNNPQCSDFTYNPGSIATLAQSPNLQSFSFNSAPVALIGMSSEYLCHVQQPGSFTDPCNAGSPSVTPNNSYCTWANYRAYIDKIASSGLNVIQLWLGLSHSPGKARGGSPYPAEQPFHYDSTTGQWSLMQYEPVYFQRLQCVVAYAATKGVMVELTLFDPWQGNCSGNWNNGPWKDSFNTEANTGFTAQAYLGSFQNTSGSGSDTGANANARARQDAFVTKVVTDLNPYPNIYWEVANEPDLGGIVTGTASMQWQDHVASVIQAAEVGKKQHLIGVNAFTNTALDTLTSRAQVVSGHYVSAEGSAPGDVGAIELLRARDGLVPFNGKIFGFNETRSTPDPAIPSSARSEAWEFMVSEGGLYDNYNLKYKSAGVVDPETEKVMVQLGILRTIAQEPLNGADYATLRRDKGCGPLTNCWIRNQAGYGAADASMSCGGTTWNGFAYWTAMHTPSYYLLYRHHSRLSHLDPGGAKLTRYVPPPAGCPAAGSEYRETTLQFRPEQAGHYRVEWLEPATGTVKVSSCLNNLTQGVDYALVASHKYTYDVALRIRKLTSLCV